MGRLTSVVILVTAAVLLSCGGGSSETPQCEDDIDNDNDGFTDSADPACAAGNDLESEDPETACDNGLDDDNDGLTDFPDDPGCDSADDDDEFGSGLPDCNDGRDNDSDGFTDYPTDPGCLTPLQDNEMDDCPSGPNCPECGDGMDNDFDNQTDFAGGDTDCDSASDDSELDIQPNACGNGTSVQPLPASGMVQGTLGTGISNLMPVQCPGAVGTGTEAAYIITVAEAETIVATTDDPATTVDTVLYLRRNCTNSTSELACANDISQSNTRSTLTASLTPGTYFLIVDARAPGSSGGYVLRVARFNALGEACTGEPDCAPEHLCRVAAGGTGTTCELAVCGDGRDDDNDGETDFPNDPGCTSALDADETDSCPGAGCPACANGIDDDGDGDTDFPDDSNCASASAASEFNCTGGDPVRIFQTNVTGQSTSSLANDYQLTCGIDGRDEVWLMQVNTDLEEIRIDTIGSSIDTAIALRRGSCGGFDLQCDDDSGGSGDSSLFLVGISAGEYYLIVDDKNTSGTYNLNVRGIYANGAACDPTSTAFVCGAGHLCEGPPGNATCNPTACNDTVDEDGDGLGGFPSDPGCATSTDDDETDTCPAGPGCPQCADDIDNDGDGFTDYGDDPGCTFAAQDSELAPCTSVDPVANFTANLSNVSGIGGRLNDVQLSCGVNGRDDIYRLVVPSPLTNLRIDTLGSPLDTVVGLRVGTCNSSDLACDDNTGLNGDSLINRTNVSPGEYFIVVEDRFVASPGTYNLNVRGTLAVGASCDPASALFFCPDAHACVGAPGSETCEPAACNDTIDQDGDGHPGFPTDPGCTSVSDPDESDDCPSGPSCPACGNGVNDDGDPWTDYPTDPGCTSANDSSELQCTSVDPIVPFTANVTGATTTGRTNDITLSCGSNGRDEVYRFVVDRPLQQLRADTIGSDLDTVVGIRRTSCATADLVCNDDGAGNLDSLAVVASPAFGEYYIIVDDRTNSNAAYNLNITGVLPNGATCTPGDTRYVCGTGFVCGGTAGAETCVAGPCGDQIDQDGDGFVGFPTDPGCTSTLDMDEVDTCPAGPGCPICSDDIDNDMDGFTDYPADPTCASASDNVEAASCNSADPILTYTGQVTGATINTRLNDVTLSCGTNGRDEIYRLVIDRPLARLTASTLGSALDTVVGIRRTNCNGTDLVCDDNGGGNGDSVATIANVTPGEYWVIVDDRNVSGAATYDLLVTAELPVNAACVPGATLYVCGLGAVCSGTAGAETCVPAACNDQVDADGDGFPGFPTDPGCTSITDNDESDTCPGGAGCPACGNDLDDDMDTLVDYPADYGCASASFGSEEECPQETDPITLITGPLTTGTTTGASNTFTPACQTSNNSDVAYVLSLPVPVATLRIDTEGSTGNTDTILQLFDIQCSAAIGCDDDSGTGLLSSLTVSNVQAGNYIVSVDGFGSTNGAFNLNIRGTVAAGTACNFPQFTSGLLVCPTGTTCNGTCQ